MIRPSQHGIGAESSREEHHNDIHAKTSPRHTLLTRLACWRSEALCSPTAPIPTRLPQNAT